MYLLRLPVAAALCLLLSFLSPVSALATPVTPRGGSDKSQFVTVSSSGTRFHHPNGKDFAFVGTNAYWLPYLNTDDDIRHTLANMSKSGITVVRTWAFNDVLTVPTSGNWILLIKNGSLTFNTGANGIQRLDKLIKLAKEYNIYIQFSLTNNWFPDPPDNCPFPRNYLSNSYGGMDAYVKVFGKKKTHDEFYTSKKIRKEFNKYVKFIVERYANEPNIIAWELANDARCSSTLPASDHCNTNTVTQWHADTAKFVRSIDCNHLITPGVHGSLCPTCPKLFPLPHARKRTPGFMPASDLGKRSVEPREPSDREGMTIRGLWTSPAEAKKRNNDGAPSVFDGAFGVDSQDILNAPDIDFGSFQVFPDSVNYGTGSASDVTPPSRNFGKTLNETVAWINSQTCAARDVGKPIVISAFGIVTTDNLPFFVPFDKTSPVVNSKPKRQSDGTFGTGVTGAQVDNSYSTWAGQPGTGGATQYQWSATGVAAGGGTVPYPPPAGGTPNTSPNDGMGITGPDEAGVAQTLQNQASVNQGQ